MMTLVAKRILLVALQLGLGACGDRHEPSAAAFVGKWKSEKMETPIVLYDNGEWEIRREDGKVLQYGIWEYRDGRLIWSFQGRSTITRDVNPVVSVTDKEFSLREATKVVVFKRLE